MIVGVVVEYEPKLAAKRRIHAANGPHACGRHALINAVLHQVKIHLLDTRYWANVAL